MKEMTNEVRKIWMGRIKMKNGPGEWEKKKKKRLREWNEWGYLDIYLCSTSPDWRLADGTDGMVAASWTLCNGMHDPLPPNCCLRAETYKDQINVKHHYAKHNKMRKPGNLF